MRFKVVIEHTSSSLSVGYVEAASFEEAQAQAMTADWSQWHTEREVADDTVIDIVAQDPAMPPQHPLRP